MVQMTICSQAITRAFFRISNTLECPLPPLTSWRCKNITGYYYTYCHNTGTGRVIFSWPRMEISTTNFKNLPGATSQTPIPGCDYRSSPHPNLTPHSESKPPASLY